jgi:hypothetical protein
MKRDCPQTMPNEPKHINNTLQIPESLKGLALHHTAQQPF